MGTYGTVRAATIDPKNDIEILYNYNPSRYTEDGDSSSFTELASTYLEKTYCNSEAIPGLYNLKLPLSVFRQKGYYTIYIRPKEFKATIKDVGNLSTYSDVRGIVFDSQETGITEAGLTTSNSLVGYRVEFYNTTDGERSSDSVLITSSNRCEGITNSLSDDAGDSLQYRFSTFGSLIFCTVTPSLASSFKPNDAPYIGEAGQEVAIVNTKFNPILLELEIVEHDDETISYMLEGEQIHDIDHGIITTFNDNREIYHQVDYKSLKDSLGHPAYTVKVNRDNIDTTQDIDAILEDTVNNS